MIPLVAPIRQRLDRAGIALSALCAVHCLLSVVLVSVIGLGAEALLDPAIHRIGLLLATLIAQAALAHERLRLEDEMRASGTPAKAKSGA